MHIFVKMLQGWMEDWLTIQWALTKAPSLTWLLLWLSSGLFFVLNSSVMELGLWSSLFRQTCDNIRFHLEVMALNIHMYLESPVSTPLLILDEACLSRKPIFGHVLTRTCLVENEGIRKKLKLSISSLPLRRLQIKFKVSFDDSFSYFLCLRYRKLVLNKNFVF